MEKNSTQTCSMIMDNENETTTFSPLLVEEEVLSRSSIDSNIFFKYIRPCVAEMFATATFVFVDVCSSHYYFGTAFAHAFILFVNVAATANVR